MAAHGKAGAAGRISAAISVQSGLSCAQQRALGPLGVPVFPFGRREYCPGRRSHQRPSGPHRVRARRNCSVTSLSTLAFLEPTRLHASHNFPAPRRPIPHHESADQCVGALERRRFFPQTCAARELIRAASQPFWKEVNTLETEKPARGGPCCPARSRESLRCCSREIPKNQRSRQVETLFPLTG